MRLRRENTELKMDREILLKASVFFELGLVSSYDPPGTVTTMRHRDLLGHAQARV